MAVGNVESGDPVEAFCQRVDPIRIVNRPERVRDRAVEYGAAKRRVLAGRCDQAAHLVVRPVD